MASVSLQVLNPNNPVIRSPSLLQQSAYMLGRIITKQNIKSGISIVSVAACAKRLVDSSVNFSRYGRIGLVLAEKAFKTPVSAFAGGYISDSSCITIDALRVHVLAVLRIGICVTAALSLLTLLKSSGDVRAIFSVVGIFQSGLTTMTTIRFASKSFDSVKDLISA